MKDPTPIVFVVDDEASVRNAVARLMRSAGLAARTFASPQEFLDAYQPETHGCAVLDIAMPQISGLELQQALVAADISLPIVFLTGRGDIPISVRAMKQGAADFLTKPIDSEELIAAVRTAIARDVDACKARVERTEVRRRLATLTAREREVLEHVVAGKLNKQTAADLGTVEKTIKVHRARVMQKMNVQSVAELVRLSESGGVTPCAATP
jgi:FixJ family two-component response regulator